MGTLRIRKHHELTKPGAAHMKQRGIRTCVLSELAAVVTTGHVDHRQLLIVVCSGLDRILDFLRYLVDRLCRGRAGAHKEQWSVAPTCTAKPLPDLLKDLPSKDTAHIKRHPDVLKVPDHSRHSLYRAQPGRAQYLREAFQWRLTSGGNRVAFRTSSMGGSFNETVGLPEPNVDLKYDGEGGEGALAAPEGAAGGEATDINKDTIDALTVAIRKIGDNLDVAMRNHKEPVVRAAFRNAGTFFGYELLMAFRADVMLRIVGTSLQLMDFIGRL